MDHNHQMSNNANPSVANEGGVTAAGAPPPVAWANTTQATSSPAQPDDDFPEEAKGAKAQLGRFYACLWTLFDYEQHLDRLRAYANHEKGPDYMVWGFETCPKTGRPHLQGYVHWANKRSIGAFSETFGNCWVHKPHASAAANRDYCLKIRPQDPKPNERWEEFGDVPRQGARADWSQAVEQLRTQRVVDVVDAQPHLLPSIRALKEYHALCRTPPKDRDVRVLYIHGNSGVGKTRAIHAAFPDAYWKPHGDWWDGYSGESVVVLDDFYSDIQHQLLLRVLDRYPLRLPFKGGFVVAAFTTVIITSNAYLHDQYPTFKEKQREPLYRRIHRVIHADHGFSPEHITDALQAPPQHPQAEVRKAIRPPPDDPSDSADTPDQRA